MKKNTRDIGYDVKSPEKTCSDPRCPFHGTLPIRGKILEGLVKSEKMQNTVIVEINTMKFIRKYERYERRHKRMAVHKTECITVKKGDKVKFAECRPISKTKNFVIIERLE